MRKLVIICDKCSKKEYPDNCHDSTILKIMLDNSLCCKCATWKHIIDRDGDKLKIIDGYAYSFYPPQYSIVPNGMLGQNGKWVYVLEKNGKVIKSNDVWPCGKVPDQYRKELPDDGWFITKRAYNIIKMRNSPCKKKGCVDRFHCYLYDLTTEKEELFVKPKRNHIVGEEKCPSFVNILKDIHRYDVLHQIDSQHLSFKK